MKICRDKMIGKVKPMHAVNNVPIYTPNGEHQLFKLCTEAVPMVRFHDTAFIYPFERFVDIPFIFRDFDADENDPASYDFTFTDSLISQVVHAGVKVFYRLGVSIENYTAVKSYHIHPPKDFAKWARICEHIIAHYNEGWADGFHYDIEYWEIWNEPENYPEIKNNQMWKGTFEEFMRLYKITANHLKNRFPDIKVGGYASCGFYAILEERAAENAKVSTRTGYFVDCVHRFLQYISSAENRAPLDFFSWHSYSGVESNIKYAEYARQVLDEYGFTTAESFLNEWNPGIQFRGTAQDGSNIVANMIALQNAPVDMLMYYDARLTTTYCGMFSPIGDAYPVDGGKALPAYYGFKAFNELYKLGNQVEIEVDGENIFALAATKEGKTAVLITNNKAEEQVLDLAKLGTVEKLCSITDTNKLDEVALEDNQYTLQGYETVLIYLS